jgi:hypothetical protein
VQVLLDNFVWVTLSDMNDHSNSVKRCISFGTRPEKLKESGNRMVARFTKLSPRNSMINTQQHVRIHHVVCALFIKLNDIYIQNTDTLSVTYINIPAWFSKEI